MFNIWVLNILIYIDILDDIYIMDNKTFSSVKKTWNDALYERILEDLRSSRSREEAEKLVARILAVNSKPPMFTTFRVNTLIDSVENTRQLLQKVLEKQYEESNELCPTVLVHPVISDVLVVANKGPLNRVKQPTEVIVSYLCGNSVLRGANVFAQGIMGAPANMQKGDLVSVYADLDERCLKGSLCRYHGNKVFVGTGVAHLSRSQLFAGNNKPSGIGVLMTQPLYMAPSVSDVLPTRLFPQNLPSAVTAHVLDPQPGETILDMCAAPGGKTTHIAAIMNNTGLLVAFDKTKGKVQKIRDNAAQWNIHNTKTYAFDATKSLSKDGLHGNDFSPPYPPASFDRVLLDAPCSALGQRPCLLNKMTPKQLDSYPILQRQLFATAVELLKPGGVLVYSTCTVTIQENEGLVAWALNKYPWLQLQPQEPHVGGRGWRTEMLDDTLTSLLQRFDPSVKVHTQSCDEHEVNVKVNTSELQGDIDPEQSCDVDSVNTSVSTDDTIKHLVRSLNVDTIGFFIAKFLKP